MNLNYIKLGDNRQSFIILHGLFGNLDNWMTLGKRFSMHFSVYLVDARNHGRSPWHDRIDYPSMAQDIADFIRDKGLDKPHILGHSMGGKTAMQLALNQPDIINKLIVVDIAPDAYPVRHQTIIEALKTVEQSNPSSRKEAEQILSRFIPEPPVIQFLAKNLYRTENGTYRWRFNLSAIDRYIVEISGPVSGKYIFDKPALFIRGEFSDYILPTHENNIKKFFPASKIVTIEKAGHWVHAEQPEIFFQTVMGFLQEN